MPHIIVKVATGKSEQQKIRLAEEITRDVMEILNCGEDAVSVAVEEIEPNEWASTVYAPDIQGRRENLYKKPGYTISPPGSTTINTEQKGNDYANTQTWKK